MVLNSWIRYWFITHVSADFVAPKPIDSLEEMYAKEMEALEAAAAETAAPAEEEGEEEEPEETTEDIIRDLK